ncbi:putative palmitoyltransferase ZDHHC6-like protein [Cricetulus griseus]|nr:putative palmitoyltransferase ZDHHC6-like protein [Cricetulus griseus]
MFIAEWLTVAKEWNQPRCLLTDKLSGENTAYTYSRILFIYKETIRGWFPRNCVEKCPCDGESDPTPEGEKKNR